MMAFALYIVLEPRECDDKGLDVQRLASFLHRTPSSVALKIWNIAAYDDNRKARGRVGMKHGSKLDSQVWQWYAEDPDAFMEQCLDLLRHALLQADANDFNPVPLASDRNFSLETATFLLIAERAPAEGNDRQPRFSGSTNPISATHYCRTTTAPVASPVCSFPHC